MGDKRSVSAADGRAWECPLWLVVLSPRFARAFLNTQERQNPRSRGDNERNGKAQFSSCMAKKLKLQQDRSVIPSETMYLRQRP